MPTKIIDSTLADQFFKEAKLLFNSAKYEEAQALYKRAAILYKKLELWKKHVKAQRFYSVCYRFLSKFQHIHKAYQETLTTALEKLGKYSAETAHTYTGLSIVHLMMNDFESAHYCLKESLDICLKIFGEECRETASVYGKLGSYFMIQGLVKKSLVFQEKSLAILLENSVEKDIDLALTYGYISYALGQKGDIEQEIHFAKKSIASLLEIVGEKHDYVATTYANLGVAYGKQGDFQQRLHYQQKSLSILLDLFGEKHLKTALLFCDLANTYGAMEQHEKELFYAQKGVASLKQVFENQNQNAHIGYAYEALGNAYENLQDYQKAIEFYQKFGDIEKQIQGEETLNMAYYHFHIGRCYGKMKECEKAEKHLSQSLHLLIITVGIHYPKVAETHNHLANIYAKKKDFRQKLHHHQQALQSNCIDFKADNLYENPSLNTYNNPWALFKTLAEKAATLHQLYQQSKTIKDLKAALQTYQLLINFIYKTRNSYKTETAKLSLAKEAENIYEKAINIAYQLDEFSKIFAFSEQAKAALLLANLQDMNAKTLTDIPDELLAEEKKLKIELNYLDKQIAQEEAKKEKKDEQHLLSLQAEYFDFKKKYDQLIEKFEKSYPDYFQLKYNNKTATIPEIQENLAEEAILVNYYVGEKKYYISTITKEESIHYELEKPSNFEESIRHLVKAIKNHNKKEFIHLSHQIFQWLFAPIADLILDPFSDTADKKLTIIPHGILNYLPFEALLYEKAKEKDDYKNLSFLLQQCVISYHYSATLWINGLAKNKLQQQLPNSFAGFAPVYTTINQKDDMQEQLIASANQMRAWASRSAALNKEGWNPLPYSKTEVNNVQKLFEKKGYPTQAFLHKNANKQTFIQEAAKAKYLLIAAHGLVNDEQADLSGLVFFPTNNKENIINKSNANNNRSSNENISENADCILSMKDAYLLNLQANLVVLSSCESGIGKLAKGEGMMAINRGFLYSGVSNVIFTLFKVYDKPSSELIRLLFTNILNGESYALALRNAKLSLLKEGLADPKLWTSYVLIGC